MIAQLGYAVRDLSITYSADREFGQIVTFTLLTAQQSIVTLPGDDEALILTLNANKVSDLDYFHNLPMGDVQKRDYVHSARGMQSIEYLLLVARAHLCSKSRAVEVQIKTGFKQALRAMSLRKATLVDDPRLPGGQAVGKNITVTLSLNGEDGAATGTITIACCVGYGGSYTSSPGTPAYVDTGYMDNVQQFTGQIVVTDTADIAWTVTNPAFFDDGLDFMAGLTADNAVLAMSVINTAASQEAALAGFINNANVDQSAVAAILQNIPTQVSVQMKPMKGGPFQQEVVISVSDLIVPKQIDLEAPSNA